MTTRVIITIPHIHEGSQVVIEDHNGETVTEHVMERGHGFYETSIYDLRHLVIREERKTPDLPEAA